MKDSISQRMKLKTTKLTSVTFAICNLMKARLGHFD